MTDFILASASPRRRELLEQIGVNFICAPQDIDESILRNETPEAYVERLAREKAARCANTTDIPVLGSDTCVVLEGKILSKPASIDDAKTMLACLSGRNHQVLTAIAMCTNINGELVLTSQVVATEVSFINITAEQIAQYVDTGEPMDKAGSYGIQGKAAIFVSGIVGSYSNVVGLPLMETAQLLRQNDIPVWCV